MPEKMLFGDIIQSQGVSFIAHLQSEGGYIDGEWVDGIPKPEELIGVILPLTAGTKSVGEALSYMENGKYTTKERKLLTTTEIPEGTLVEYKEQKYTVQAFTDFTDYTDVHIYIMRWRKK
ncbi:hypothetical protein [Lysinibacillus sp. NPDC092081]|uniref:hypothetical protein n=1 Tax=Lysinibacillus sp. NPDC092081 TaxID=3364131 RepID=UPI00381E64AD